MISGTYEIMFSLNVAITRISLVNVDGVVSPWSVRLEYITKQVK